MNVVTKIIRGPSLLNRPLVFSRAQISTSKPCLKTFEPDYLDAAGPQIPLYPPLNIQVKGYNFDVLESLQSWIHRMAENMGITVSDAWATPAKSYTMTTYHPGGTLPRDTFDVNLFERNVQVVNMRSIDAPLLLDTVRRALPEGVTMTIHEHTVEMAEERWISDPFIDSLRSQISSSKDSKETEQAKKAEYAVAKAARKRAELLKSLSDE